MIFAIFSPFVGFLFIFLMVSFQAQKCLILIKPSISIFFFFCLLFWCSKNPFAKSKCQNIYLYVFFNKFYTNGFWSIFSFCMWYEISKSTSFFCILLSSCPTTFLEEKFFPRWMALASLSKISWPQMFCLFQDS